MWNHVYLLSCRIKMLDRVIWVANYATVDESIVMNIFKWLPWAVVSEHLLTPHYNIFGFRWRMKTSMKESFKSRLRRRRAWIIMLSEVIPGVNNGAKYPTLCTWYLFLVRHWSLIDVQVNYEIVQVAGLDGSFGSTWAFGHELGQVQICADLCTSPDRDPVYSTSNVACIHTSRRKTIVCIFNAVECF